jgi:hypothetical protein
VNDREDDNVAASDVVKDEMAWEAADGQGADVGEPAIAEMFGTASGRHRAQRRDGKLDGLEKRIAVSRLSRAIQTPRSRISRSTST